MTPLTVNCPLVLVVVAVVPIVTGTLGIGCRQ
jgi:hypothetical protein